MDLSQNKGFDPGVIKEYKVRIDVSGKNFLPIDSEESSDECQHFYFVGKYEGKEVIYDAAVYTLRLAHQSELFEIAEHKAAQYFPDYRKIIYEEDENGNLLPLSEREEEIGLYLAEVIMDLEEEGDIKVSEHAEIDPSLEFGVGLDAGLNVETITPAVIEKLIRDFNDDMLVLDDSLVSFETQQEE